MPKNDKKLILSIRKELLRAIRGERSQNAVNRKLEKTFNQVYRWESGQSRISWLDFVELCRICKAPLKETMKAVWTIEFPAAKTDLLVRCLVGPDQIGTACEQFGVSRFVLSDWMKNRSVPPLDAILRYLHHRSMLVSFVRNLTNINLVPSLAREIETVQAEIDLSYKYAYTTHVQGALLLDAYQKLPKHKEGYVSEKVGITLDEEKVILSLLKKISAIELKNGKFVVNSGNRLQDYRSSFEGGKEIKLYWMRRALSILESLTDRSTNEIFGQGNIAVSDTGYLEIVEAYRDFMNKLVVIHQADKEPLTRVINLNFQLFDPGRHVHADNKRKS